MIRSLLPANQTLFPKIGSDNKYAAIKMEQHYFYATGNSFIIEKEIECKSKTRYVALIVPANFCD